MTEQIVCLDYDGTYNKFQGLCHLMIDYCKKNKIKIILATMRSKLEVNEELYNLEKILDGVYYTNRKAKSEYLLREHGIVPSIWLDDQPFFIYKDG